MRMSQQVESTHLRLDENEIYKQDDKVMFYIFVCKAFAVRALCQSDTFTERPVICLAVCCIKMSDGSAAGDTYRHDLRKGLSISWD